MKPKNTELIKDILIGTSTFFGSWATVICAFYYSNPHFLWLTLSIMIPFMTNIEQGNLDTAEESQEPIDQEPIPKVDTSVSIKADQVNLTINN